MSVNRHGKLEIAPNKSMDVSAKQRLFITVSFDPLLVCIRFCATPSPPFAAFGWQSGNFTLLESNRTIQFNSLATALLKINNVGGNVLAPFGVNLNEREGKRGVVKINLSGWRSWTLRVSMMAAANNSMDVRRKQRLCYRGSS